MANMVKLRDFHRKLSARKAQGSLQIDNKKHYFSTGMPQIQIETANAKRTLNVTISSSIEDDQRLLHLLFQKVRQ
jgi:hypothetical protein